MESNLLFFICIVCQIVALFVQTNLRLKMILLIGAILSAIGLCFISPVGPLWLIVVGLCGFNAWITYKKMIEVQD